MLVKQDELLADFEIAHSLKQLILNKTKTPNFTFLGVKKGVNLANA